MIVADAAICQSRAEANLKADLNRLLRPRSIAIVGAQPERTTIGGSVYPIWRCLVFAGAIHLVSRSRDRLEKNPTALRQARMVYKYIREMTWEESAEYLTAKADQTTFVDKERGREKGLAQSLDEKTYRPGLGIYQRAED